MTSRPEWTATACPSWELHCLMALQLCATLFASAWAGFRGARVEDVLAVSWLAALIPVVALILFELGWRDARATDDFALLGQAPKRRWRVPWSEVTEIRVDRPRHPRARLRVNLILSWPAGPEGGFVVRVRPGSPFISFALARVAEHAARWNTDRSARAPAVLAFQQVADHRWLTMIASR